MITTSPSSSHSPTASMCSHTGTVIATCPFRPISFNCFPSESIHQSMCPRVGQRVGSGPSHRLGPALPRLRRHVHEEAVREGTATDRTGKYQQQESDLHSRSHRFTVCFPRHMGCAGIARVEGNDPSASSFGGCRTPCAHPPCRGGAIRTLSLLLPKQVAYQVGLHPGGPPGVAQTARPARRLAPGIRSEAAEHGDDCSVRPLGFEPRLCRA